MYRCEILDCLFGKSDYKCISYTRCLSSLGCSSTQYIECRAKWLTLTNATAPLMLHICYKAFHIASLMIESEQAKTKSSRASCNVYFTLYVALGRVHLAYTISNRVGHIKPPLMELKSRCSGSKEMCNNEMSEEGV